MKRITAVLSALAVAAALAGCSAVSGPSGLDPVDLSNPDTVQSLDCDTSGSVAEFVSAAKDAPANSGKRHALTEWGVDPKNEDSLATLVAALNAHTTEVCGGNSSSTETVADAEDNPNAGVSDAESSVTLDSSVWGNPDNWDYPANYTALVKKFNFSTQTVKGQVIPRFQACTSPYREGRLWTDAILPPLAEKSAEQVFALILACPDYGAHVASGLAQDQTRVLAGKTLLALNPWLQEFKDPAGINDWAQAALNGKPAQQLVAAKKLALVVMLLASIDQTPTIGDRTTILNYHLVVGEVGGVLSLDPSAPYKVREFELNPVQYRGEFLIFALSFKGQTGCWLEVLINTQDGRFALAQPGCERPPTAPPSGCVSNCHPVCVHCLKGKDTDPGAYQGPGKDDTRDAGEGDKPKATDDGGESTPPQVETTPSPSPSPSPPQSNEGGDN